MPFNTNDNMTSSSYGFSMHFAYIDEALRSRWDSFVAIEREMNEFKPKPRSDFEEARNAQVVHLRNLNPDASVEALEAMVDSEMETTCSPWLQVYQKFAKPLNAEYVTIVMLAHSLCEALINTTLAIGLTKANATDLFEILERADICKKWQSGPKAFLPAYDLPAGEALGQTLKYLTKIRNSYVHYKIDLHVEGKQVLKGSMSDGISFDDKLKWARRFFSLPYDLAEFLVVVWKEAPPILLHRGSIERVVAHRR